MFQPARPPLTWSTDASRRARLYGSLYVDDTVAMSPILLVAWDRAVSSVSGSSWPGGRNSPVPMIAGPSARNSESNLAFSANRASLIQCCRSKSARGLPAGSRHDASWWPASMRKALRWSWRCLALTSAFLSRSLGG
jgi:hypothetical protein